MPDPTQGPVGPVWCVRARHGHDVCQEIGEHRGRWQRGVAAGEFVLIRVRLGRLSTSDGVEIDFVEVEITEEGEVRTLLLQIGTGRILAAALRRLTDTARRTR